MSIYMAIVIVLRLSVDIYLKFQSRKKIGNQLRKIFSDLIFELESEKCLN